ncbi:hypothetical protein [Verrucomicrobium sp. BvORR106]|uniref:hypothetical protein n=1 Tax=Verrucomicrobium sp. BvORR106 TaxID=1403819 RepID=UPI002240EA00|nr:hypothetical protein [Verrucomicrobium sp. BvORR106]
MGLCFAWGTLLLAATSCVAHKQYRSDYSTEQLRQPPKSLASPHPVVDPASVSSKSREHRVFEVYGDTFKLAHIECDDQGSYWETTPDNVESVSGIRPGRGRNQIEFMEETLEADLAKNRARYRNGVIILAFAHGWNNNAQEKNDNLKNFRHAAYEVWKDENTKPGALKRPVIAIYLSWRGRVIPNATTLGIENVKGASFIANVPHYFSFWNRKGTAEEIGYRAMAESLKRISLIRRRFEEVEPRSDADKNSRAIIVGHSFGAAAVFSSVSRSYEDDLMELVYDHERRKKRPWVHRNWDLVVLVNPAFEALRYVTIARYSRDQRLASLAESQRVPYIYLPRMIVVGSNTDVPNKTLFPIGQTLGNLTTSTQKTPWIEQRGRLRTALGAYRPFATHDLVKSDNSNCPAMLRAIPLAEGKSGLGAMKPLSANEHGRSFMSPFQSQGVVDDASSIGPFMVAQADKAVIDGHGDIWNERFRIFITRLIEAREMTVNQMSRRN